MEGINLPGQDRVLTTANALNDNFTTHLIWKVLLYSQKKPRYLSLKFYGHHNSKKYALIVNGHAELNYTKDNSVLIVFSYIKVISKNAIHAFLHLWTLTPVILKLLLWLPHWLLDTPAVTTSQICSHSIFFFWKKKKRLKTTWNVIHNKTIKSLEESKLLLAAVWRNSMENSSFCRGNDGRTSGKPFYHYSCFHWSLYH